MKGLAVYLSVVVLLASSWVQADTSIKVVVDGSQVQFGAVGPQSVQGRVLVPLRGVLERVGAYVGWNSATRQVIAQKGDRDVSLVVGSKYAVINGDTVTMDVPAVIKNGTTMVPLRFLGEALGAQIKWEGATKTVDIRTDESPGSGSPGTSVPDKALEITYFSHNADAWLNAGDALSVTMQGTPKAKASFGIPGVVNQISMTETSPGKYTAKWTVPAAATSISNASVIGTLAAGGETKVIQAGLPVKIDVSYPIIRSMSPEEGSQSDHGNMDISAVWDDGSGSGIDTSSAILKVNGKDVTDDASVTNSFINYKPKEPIAAGDVSVSLSVADRAGNKSVKSWKFKAVTVASVITSFTFDASDNLAPGDVVSARLEGRSGASASFWFVNASGEKLRTQQMQETSAGVYVGEYTVRKGDDLSNAKVVGSLKLPSGASYSLTAKEQVFGPEISPDSPKIVQPGDGDKVDSRITVVGTALPNAKVRIKIDYSMLLLGALPMNGTLADQVVEADDKGKFTSRPIDLATLIKGKDTNYTLTAVATTAAGKESDPTVVTFTRK